MEIISTKRGGKKLCLDGYIYTIKNIAKSKDEVSWRCVKCDCAMKCSAMLKTNKEYTGARLVKEHSHPADETGVSVEKCRHSMKSSASTANDKPNQILTFAAAAAPDEVQARLPAAETIKRVLRRVRAHHRPKDPNTLHELIIEGQWSQTSGEHPTTFLKYDNGQDANCVKCYYIIVIKCGKGCTINVVITVVLFACLIIENLIQKYIWPKRPPSKMAEPKRPWPKRPSPKRPWPKRPTFP